MYLINLSLCANYTNDVVVFGLMKCQKLAIALHKKFLLKADSSFNSSERRFSFIKRSAKIDVMLTKIDHQDFGSESPL